MLSQETIIALHTELTTDPETLGYVGTAGADHALLVQERSFSPQQYLDPDIAPRELAGLLIQRGAWADVADAVATNTHARHFHEAAHLDVTIPYTKAATVVTGLVGAGILAAADATALAAFRPEEVWTRAEQLGVANLTIQDVESALDYVP